MKFKIKQILTYLNFYTNIKEKENAFTKTYKEGEYLKITL